MKCLVTGGTGHIGSHLIRWLIGRGCEVGALLRDASDPWRIEDCLSQVKVISGDLTDMRRSKDALRSFAAEVVFHLSWQGVHPEERENPAFMRANIDGSMDLFSLTTEAGAKTWIGLGSQAEYGYGGVLSEDASPRPKSAYGVSKYCAGLLLRKLSEASGINFKWLRLFAAYGPMESPRHLIPYLATTLLKGETPKLTFGEQQWDYLYVEDAARAMWAASLDAKFSGIYNLGSGQTRSIRDIAIWLRDRINPELKIGFGERPNVSPSVMRLQADIERFQRDFSWSPEVSMEEGLERTTEWYRRHIARFS